MKMEINCFPRAAMGNKLLFLFAFLLPSVLLAQNLRPVQGTVLDGKNPLEGVSVIVKGTNRGVSTDGNGKFIISVKNDDVLEFTFSTFQRQQVPVRDKTSINVNLKEGSSELDQVVVVGYGTKRKVTLTGSVASVGGRDIQRSPVVNLSNALAGQLPGLIAVNRSGEPGRDEAQILIRGRNTTGNNSPLVLVDNVEYPGWERLNPNDIESISVLKDASAAIYGVRAANGVMLITTKRGVTGKPTISYSFNQGLSQPTRIPKMASSAVFAEYINDFEVLAGRQPRYTQDELRKFADGSDPVNYPNINWHREVLRKTTPQSQHYLSTRGGTDNVKYAISGAYSHQEGIFKGGSTDFKTYSIRSNLDLQVNKHIRVGFDVNAGIDNGNYPPVETVWRFQLIPAHPTLPVYWQNGLPTPGFVNANPVVLSSASTGNFNNRSTRLQGRANFEVTIPWVEGLAVDGFFVYNNVNNQSKNWTKPSFVYTYDKATNVYTKVPALFSPPSPTLTQSNGNNRYSWLNMRIRYERIFKNHNISAFIAGEQQEGYNNSFSAGRVNYVTPAIDELFAGSLTNQTTGGSASENGRQNLFGRFSYGYLEKYLVDFNARYDGSANFPPGKRFGFFPGVSVAWRASQEKFISENLPAIEELKFRASYGEIGNDQVPAYQYLASYTFSGGYNFGQTAAPTQGLVPGVSPNPNISWEVAKLKNIGLDASLWNGALGIVFDVFKQKRTNILASRGLAVPTFAAISLPNENFGVVENKGFELQLSSRKSFGDFSYRVSGNVAFARNKVIDIAESANVPAWQKMQGRILGAVKVYNAIGIFRSQEHVDKTPKLLGTLVGDLIYEDVNKDGAISAADMVVLDKSNIPEVTFGLNLAMSYKNFSLWSLFAGQDRAWTFFYIYGRTNSNSLEDVLLNRWRPGSMDSKYPRLKTTGQQESTFWLKNARFVRLKTLELSYDVPKRILNRVRISSLRLYANGNNLFTIDDLKWFDPEGIGNQGDFHPQSKIYNFGFNVSF
jgi:TonB-linked SusC/RagA family outer membrane protein